MKVEVNLDTGEVIQRIEGLEKRVGGGLGPDFAGPAISMEVAAIEREWFETEGKGSWPPLSPATLASRANRWGYYAHAPAPGVGASGPVLQWTRRLANSLGDPRGRGAADAMIRMHPDVLEQGTLVPYARYHMSTRPPVKSLTEKDLDRLRNVMLLFLEGYLE